MLAERNPGAERDQDRQAARDWYARSMAEWRKLAEASEAFGDGRGEEARALLASIPVARLPKGAEDDYAYLKAMLADDGAANVAALFSPIAARIP